MGAELLVTSKRGHEQTGRLRYLVIVLVSLTILLTCCVVSERFNGWARAA